MSRVIDLVGKQFGKLTVLSFAENRKGLYFWKCSCECGNIKIIRGSSMKGGVSKSCGCYRPQTLPKGEAAFNGLYKRYKKSASRREYTFNLTKKYFRKLVIQDCHYCGIGPSNEFKYSHCNGTFIYNGIDRLNNNLGYSIKNCVPCCKICNFLKNKMLYSTFIGLITKIYKYRSKNAH